MSRLIKIGNSQGIRIPKPLIQQAGLENVEITLTIVSEGILIKPQKKPRADWDRQIAEFNKVGKDPAYDNEWLDADLGEESDEW